MSTVLTGLQGKIYIGNGVRATWSATVVNGIHTGAAPTSLLEATVVRNADLGLKDGEADVSSRATYWKLYAQAQTDGSIDLEIPWNPSDPAFILFRNAKILRTSLPIACLDGSAANSGSQGLWADMAVLDFSRGEPIDKEMMTKVTLKPTASAVVPEWVQVN